MKLNRTLTPYVFLFPALLILAVASFWPVLQAIYLSFTDYDIIRAPNFIGLKNYEQLWRDQLFWKVLFNTLIYMVVVVPSLVVLPLFLAILVNQKVRGIQFFRAAYYVPVIVSVVVAGIAWKWIYAENGLLNYFASIFTSVKIPWLTDPSTAIFAIIAVTIWKGLGYYMVIYLAGLQTIPQDLYEAAAIDGSDGWRKHLDITIPMLKPYIVLVTVISAIAAMKVFEEVYVMSRGGPANSSKTVVYYLYEKGFSSLEMGYASAIGVVLFLVVFLLSVISVRSVDPTGGSMQ
ncbi:MAG: sugar ABC transporter permease [Gloeobacterales cyanobacterium]